MRKFSPGFTLIELLVVISIIGVLSGLLITNMVGMRSRAADAKLKNDLSQVKTALRLYYNDYQHYPESDNGVLMGCGALGVAACSNGGVFSAGTGDTVYMRELPADLYYYSDGSDAFLLSVVLDNTTDQDIANSQTKCQPAAKAFYDGTLTADQYFLCED